MIRRLARAAFAVVLIGGIALASRASAHEGITAGEYTIVYGWLNEPPVVGQPNGITLNITVGTHEEESAAGTLTLVAPENGAEVVGDSVEVVVTADEAATAAGELHWHLYVDEQLVTMLPIETTTFMVEGLANGTHHLRATLADEQHVELGTAAEATVHVSGSTGTGVAPEGEIAGHAHEGPPAPDIDVTLLVVEVVYGAEVRELALQRLPGGEDGQYYGRITPTRAGIYTVRLSGQIGDTEVSAEVEPEEVGMTDAYAFPEPAPSLPELENLAAAAQARADTAQAIAIVSGVLGVIGLALGASALVRRR